MFSGSTYCIKKTICTCAESIQERDEQQERTSTAGGCVDTKSERCKRSTAENCIYVKCVISVSTCPHAEKHEQAFKLQAQQGNREIHDVASR